MGGLHSAKIGWPIGQKDTGVEITYGKVQRVTTSCTMDRRRRLDCGKSLDEGGTGPVSL